MADLLEQWAQAIDSEKPPQKPDLLDQWATEEDARYARERAPKLEAVPTFTSRLAEGDIPGALSIPYAAIRDSSAATQLLGPSPATLLADSIPLAQPNGETSYAYRPFANRLEREGLMTASPFVTEDTIPSLGLSPVEGESTLAGAARGVGRGAVGLVGGLTNPLSIATLGGGMTSQIPVMDRALAGAFTVDAGANIPIQIEALRSAETPGEIAESVTGLVGSIGLGGLGANYALRGAGLPMTARVLEEQNLSKTTNVERQPENPIVLEPNPAVEVPAPAQPEGATVAANDITAQPSDLAGITEEVTQESPEQKAQRLGVRPEPLVSQDGQTYANTPRMRAFLEQGNAIRDSLPPVEEGNIRLWRGNRKGEEGANPSFTSSLEGIALPFREGYEGDITYIDIPKEVAQKSLLTSGAAPGVEFSVPAEYAKNAKAVSREFFTKNEQPSIVEQERDPTTQETPVEETAQVQEVNELPESDSAAAVVAGPVLEADSIQQATITDSLVRTDGGPSIETVNADSGATISGVDNPREFKFSEITPPETIEQWSALRGRRELAERKLLEEEIGITPEQAERIHDISFKRDGNADRWAKKNLTEEQFDKYDKFFESDFNQKSGPVDFFEYDDYYNPSLLKSENNVSGLAQDLVVAFTRGVPKEGLNDKWIWTVSAIRKLQELGASREDISNALRTQSGRMAGSEGDARFWYTTHGKEINALLDKFAPDFPVSKQQAEEQLRLQQPTTPNEQQEYSQNPRSDLAEQPYENPQGIAEKESKGTDQEQLAPEEEGQTNSLDDDLIQGYVESHEGVQPFSETVKFLIQNNVPDEKIIAATRASHPNFGPNELKSFKAKQEIAQKVKGEKGPEEQKSPVPALGKWDGTNYGPQPIIAFRDKSSGDVFISPGDRIHALGLGNLVAEGNRNLVKAANRESGFLIGDKFIEGSLRNPKDGAKIAKAMEDAGRVIENKNPPTEGPGSIFPESEREAIQVQAYKDAEIIARAITKGQNDLVIEAAIQAARDNADRNIRNSKRPNTEFMRKSAKSAAQKAVERAETSLETPISEEATIGDTLASDEATAAERAEFDDAKARVTDLLKDFPEGEKNVLTLAMQGLSNSEIAARLDIKENAVRSLKNRGLNKLKNSPYILGITPDNKFAKWLNQNVRRLFTAEGDLPREVFERSIQRNGEIKEQSREIAYATRDLYSALKDEFNITTGERLLEGFSNIPKEFVNRMNQALLGQVPIDSLPEKVRGPLQAMRDHVDALSKQMIDEGLIPADLKALVDDNMGVYLTRSYRMFDDPKWLDKITPEVKNKAINYVFTERKAIDPSYTVDQARIDVDAMLQDWSDQGGGAVIKKGSKLGSKDLSSFIKRKDIPEEIRNLLGEYKNPVINYGRSVTKMANFIANERFLRDTREQGLGKFLFEDGKQPAGYSALIAAPESRVMAPLNGLRTKPQIAAAFAEFNKVDPQAKGVWRTWLILNAAAKTSKTVGSLMTQVRNAQQYYFWLMNGHYDPRPIGGATKAIFADLIGKDKTAQEAYKRYLKLGVVDQSTAANELRDVLNDAGLTDPNLDEFDKATIALGNIKKYTIGAAERAYQLSDDLGKIVGFENELATQKKIHPELPESEVEKIAAQRIRNTYPSYAMVPEVIKQWRKQPFFGPFVTFAYESYRTFAWNLRYAAEDLQSNNPAQRAAGARRAAGILAVMAGGYGLSSLSRQIMGISPEESDDARQFMAPWDKNSQLLFTGKEPGKLSFINLSYANPYSGIADLTTPVVTGLQTGQGIDEIAGEMFARAIQPFANEGILAAKLIDVARNQTANGRQVYNPADPDKTAKIMGHIAESLEPGTITRLREKIIPSLRGKTTSFGQELSPLQEIGAEVTGVKQQTLDYAQALGYKASDFREGDQNAERIFRDVALRRGTVEPQEVIDAFASSNLARYEQWQGMYRAVRAAERRGVDANEIRQSLLSRGVTQKDTKSIMQGIYQPYTPSSYFRQQLRERKREIPPEVINAIQATNGLSLDGELP